MVERYSRMLCGPRSWYGTGEGEPEDHLIETFDSLTEFYNEAVKWAKPNLVNVRPITGQRVRDGIGHDKVPSILEIASQAVLASPELRDVMTFSPVFDVAGDYTDMGRYLSGEPECMVYNPLQERNTVSPIITLVSSADNNMGEWETRGIIATALALALNRMGYSTEMWADNYGCAEAYGEGGYETVWQYQRIRLKSTLDEINPARLLYGFGHKTMLTELAFGCFDGFGRLGFEKWDYPFKSRGSARYRGDSIKALYPEGTIFVTGSLHGGASPAEVAALVTRELQDAGLLSKPQTPVQV